MKKLISICVFCLLTSFCFCQLTGFNYQAVIRDADGNVISNQSVYLDISILSGSETGNLVYFEVHEITTNDWGIINLVVGDGKNKNGNLNYIDWSSNSYFIKIELKTNDGFKLIGTSPLQSVPLAQNALSVAKQSISVESIDEALYDSLDNRFINKHDSTFINIDNLFVDIDPSELRTDVNSLRRYMELFWGQGANFSFDVEDLMIEYGDNEQTFFIDPYYRLEEIPEWSQGDTVRLLTDKNINYVYPLPDINAWRNSFDNRYVIDYGGKANIGNGIINLDATLSVDSYTDSTITDQLGTFTKGDQFGLWGVAKSDTGYTAGVYGRTYSKNGYGIYGFNVNSETIGGLASSHYGVFGDCLGNGGFVATESFGSGAYNKNGNYAYAATPNYAVYGKNDLGTWGSIGGSNWGIYGNSGPDSTNYAGYFDGKVFCDILFKGAGAFRIDHPLDPENKYLNHSFVESPDMKNIYDGVAILDVSGNAIVKLPEWFEALNKDFRYQLTCIGGFADVYISNEIKDNQFEISGGTSGLKVSWQVTGIRKDAFANENRIVVEELKDIKKSGNNLTPGVLEHPVIELNKEEDRLLFHSDLFTKFNK